MALMGQGKEASFFWVNALSNSEIDTTKNRTGWTISISLNVEEQGNINKAWDISKNILIREKIYSFKVIRPNVNLRRKTTNAYYDSCFL